MASKFVAAFALLALCHANPVLINGILYRDGRAYSVGQASSYGGGVSKAEAKADGHAAQAFGSAIGGEQLARDGYYHPGQAIAQAQAYDNAPPPFLENAYGAAKAVTQNSAYYPVPAPATVITYEQNFAPAAASSESHADSQGGGVAHSSSETHGTYSATSSNANTQGSGSADSNAKSGLGSTRSYAKSQGGGSAASSAQNNGVAGVVYPAGLAEQPAPTIVDLRTPIYYTPYVPAVPAGVASSNANVVGEGQATSSAKIGHGQGRTISWRFGTFYDAPTSAQAQANTHGGQSAAKSAVHSYYHGNDRAQSSANSHGDGSANANASVNSAGYGGARSTANVHGLYHGGSRGSADAYTQGSGSAVSSTRTQNGSAANSQANSSGFGSAHANAQSF